MVVTKCSLTDLRQEGFEGQCAWDWKPNQLPQLGMSSVRFCVSGFLLRSLKNLEWSPVQSGKYRSICILLHPLWPPPFVKDAVFPPVCIFGVSVKYRRLWLCVFMFGSKDLHVVLQQLAVFITMAL